MQNILRYLKFSGIKEKWVVVVVVGYSVVVVQSAIVGISRVESREEMKI